MLMEEKIDFNYSLIKQKLTNYLPLELNSSELRNSAVLIPIKPTLLSYDIIVTSRFPNLKHHTGEMSFPGGQFDPNLDNTLEDTAVRETFEEIGIREENIKVIGRLDDLPTLTGFIIRPFIGLIINSSDIGFKINVHEVSAVVEIPIEYIAQKGLFQEITFPKDPEHWNMLCFKYTDPHTNNIFKIWGATAHMLQEFLKKLHDIKVITPEYQRPGLLDCLEFIREQKISK